MIDNKHSACGVVTVTKDKEYKFLILLQDKKVMNWSFPKGRVEEGENPMETALRELKEETGITEVEILEFPLIEEKYEVESKNGISVKLNKYFLGIVKNDHVTIQEGEIFDYKWVTYGEAIETFVFKKENRIQVLKKAKEYLEEAGIW